MFFCPTFGGHIKYTYLLKCLRVLTEMSTMYSLYSVLSTYMDFDLVCSRYSAAPTELDITFRSCLPRVSYRALPSFHPGLCRSVVPKGTRKEGQPYQNNKVIDWWRKRRRAL